MLIGGESGLAKVPKNIRLLRAKHLSRLGVIYEAVAIRSMGGKVMSLQERLQAVMAPRDPGEGMEGTS